MANYLSIELVLNKLEKEFSGIYSSLSHAKTPTFWLALNLIFSHIVRGFPKPTTASQDLLGFYSGVYVRIPNTVKNLRLNSTYLIWQFLNKNNHSCDKWGFKCGLQVPRRSPNSCTAGRKESPVLTLGQVSWTTYWTLSSEGFTCAGSGAWDPLLWVHLGKGGEAAGWVVGFYKENETIEYKGKGQLGKVPC